MSTRLFLSTVMAAMLMVPAMALAEDQPAAAEAAPAAATATEETSDHHGKMMMRDKGKAFAEADTDKDGSLNLDEFLERHKQKFAEIDADKSGSLTQDEMKSYGEAHRGKMKERMEERKDEKAAPTE